MKVVIAQMKHETNTYSPVPTPLARFAAGTGTPPEGDDAYAAYKGTGSAIAAFIDLAAAAGAQRFPSPPLPGPAARWKTPRSSTCLSGGGHRPLAKALRDAEEPRALARRPEAAGACRGRMCRHGRLHLRLRAARIQTRATSDFPAGRAVTCFAQVCCVCGGSPLTGNGDCSDVYAGGSGCRLPLAKRSLRAKDTQAHR